MIAHASQRSLCRHQASMAGKCPRNCPPQTAKKSPTIPNAVIQLTLNRPLRNPAPISKAIGIVIAMVKTPHGLFASACTTTKASTASKITIMASTLINASAPTPRPISSFTICPSVLPRRRTDANSTIMSWTPPPIVAPIKIQSVPGRNPNCAARTGPTRGPGPAMAAK